MAHLFVSVDRQRVWSKRHQSQWRVCDIQYDINRIEETEGEPLDAEKVKNLNLYAHKSRRLKAQKLKERQELAATLACNRFQAWTLSQTAFNTEY